jgi:hypothetical protein
MFFRLVDGGFHGGVVGVALGVDEEIIFPIHLAAGTFFDVSEVDAVVFEDVEDLGEGAGFVGGGEHDGGFVFAGAAGSLAADDEEAGHVVGMVFDVLEENVQAIKLGGVAGADGGDAGLVAGKVGGGGGALSGDDGAVLGGGAEPVAALAEDLGLGINLLDLFPRLLGQKIVMDGQEHLGADFGGAAKEGVEGVDDATADAVLDGDQAVIDVAADDFFEDGGYGAKRDVIDAAAELGDRGGVAEGAFGAEEANAEGFFEGEAAAHHFAVDGVHGAVGEGAAIELADAFEDGFFAVGGVNGGAVGLLELSDLDNDASAGVEQLDDLLVELVDLESELIEGFGLGHGKVLAFGVGGVKTRGKWIIDN